jgi:amino-acid N-acetyltransferase
MSPKTMSPKTMSPKNKPSNAEHIKWFRDSSVYIDAHRGKTFVICVNGDALQSSNIDNVISDIALLNSLGVRLVVVFGADQQISQALIQRGVSRDADNTQIITPEDLPVVTGVFGEILADLSARFSFSAPDSPSRRHEVNTVTGNYIKAQPIGVVDGIDHQHSGTVRKVNHRAIDYQLSGGAITLIPSIGYSPSGETFHLEAEKVACETACELKADKLIYLSSNNGLLGAGDQLITEIDLSDYDQADIDGQTESERLLSHCDRACGQGVSRCHILSYEVDGALLEELFTRDGCGTQIVGHSYEQIRAATSEDVSGILKLIAPLEKSGVLVKRSRELLESELNNFVVIERDGLLVSCASLYAFESSGELACLVTHPDYRNSDRGDRLLDSIEKKARANGLHQLFVLTTQSAHWFSERGFKEAELNDLPGGKKDLYNYQRNSTILVKQLR